MKAGEKVCVCVCVCVCVWSRSSSEEGVDLNQLQKHSRPYMYHLVDAIIEATPGSPGGMQFNQFKRLNSDTHT